MARLTWPDYVPSTSSGPGGRTDRSTLNRTGQRLRERTLAMAAAGSRAPVVYGIDQVGPKWYAAGKRGKYLVVAAYWCVGPIAGIEAVTQRNGEALPDNVQMHHYLGTREQIVDSWLLDALGGDYTENLVGTYNGEVCALAHTVFLVPPGAEAVLDCVATVRGRLVYDPRTEQSGWSSTAALCLADYLSSPLHGPGWAVDWASVGEVADANDELLADNHPRRELNLTLAQRSSHDDWIDTLRTYAGCLIVRDGDTRRLVPDRPAPVSRAIDGEQLLDLRLRRRSAENAPTVVRVWYTDRTTTPWRDAQAEASLPGVDSGAVERRVSEVRLPGFNTHAQAVREAEERLNAATLLDLEGTARTTDESLQDRRGDIITITDELGLQDKAFRLTDVRPVALGEWALEFSEYAEAVYSDSVATGPGPVDTELPHPSQVPVVEGLKVSEELYQQQNGDYASRLRATWNAADYPYRHRYEWQVLDGDTLMWRDSTSGTEVTTPAVQELIAYTVRVRIVSDLGYRSDSWTETPITAQGKYLSPGNVPQISARQVAADAVKVEWQPAVDIDIFRYELRRGAPGVSWDDAVVVDRVDGLQARVEELAVGQHDLLIRALDSVRQYSPKVTHTSVDVSPPEAPTTLSAFEAGGETRLAWPEGRGYIAAYELRYGKVGGDWAQASQLDRVQALRYVTREIPAGEWQVHIRAVDTAGRLSPDEATTTVTVTLDTAAFLVDQKDFINPTVTNMAVWSYRPEGGTPVHYVTDMGETAADLWPDVMASYTQPLATYHAAGSSQWLSEIFDVGTEVSGTWRLEGNWRALGGEPEAAVELSADGRTWAVHRQSSVQATARYARVRLTGDDVDTLHVRVPGVRLRVDAVPREEAGQAHYDKNDCYLALDPDEYLPVRRLVYDQKGYTTTTVEAVIRTTASRNLIIASWDRSEYWRFGVGSSTGVRGTVSWNVRTDAGLIDFAGNTRVDDGLPHHIAAVFDHGELQIYVDGVLDRVTHKGSTFGSSTTRYGFINSGSEASEFDGGRGGTAPSGLDIEYLRVWSVARTDQQIRDNAFRSLSGDEAGLTGLWQFDAGGGSVVPDLTGNGYGAELRGNPQWRARGRRIVLDRSYSAVHDITVTPLGDAPRTPVVDAINLNGITTFDVFLFDNAGNRAAGDFRWKFKGV